MRVFGWLLLLASVSAPLLSTPGEAQQGLDWARREKARRGGWLQAASYSAGAVMAGEGPPYQTMVPLILRRFALLPDSAWSTTVVIQNVGDDFAALTLEYRDPAGQGIVSLEDSLPPWGSRGYDSAALASLGQPFVGSLVITSGQPMAAVVQVHDPTWAGDGLATFTPQGQGSTVLYAPRVFNDFFGWTSRLALVSGGHAAASVTIEFFSRDGEPLATYNDVLAPYGSALYDPRAVADLPGGLDGYSAAMVRSDQPLEGTVIHLNSNPAAANASALMGRPERWHYLPSLARAYSVHVATSGHVLWNPGTNVAAVTATYYNTAGQGMMADPFSIPSGSQRASFLGMKPFLPDGFIGSSGVMSSEPLVAEAWAELSVPGASTSYLGLSHPGSTLYVPALRRSAGANTRLTVQNASAQAASVTVSYYHQGGALVARQWDTLPAFTSHIYDQAQMSVLGEDFSGSAVISADQPLAAVVEEYREPVSDGLTPTPTATSTPVSTPTVEPPAQRAFFPLVVKAWPPLPGPPVLHDISLGECNDNDYQVVWDTAPRAVSYTLQEDDHPAFSSPTTIYQGSGTWYDLGNKTEDTYYYRVRGTNEWGDGPWSETKWVAVGPPMTLWTIANNTEGELTLDIHGIASRTFPPGEHAWCVPSGEHTVTARAECGSRTFAITLEPYGSAEAVFLCG